MKVLTMKKRLEKKLFFVTFACFENKHFSPLDIY